MSDPFGPIRVTVTGAAGNIGYAALFRIAAGAMLGRERSVDLRLLEIPQAVDAAEGTAMELADGAFPLLRKITVTDSLETAFDGCDVALLIGAMPRKQGMDRSDLLAANAEIFTAQGGAIGEHADENVRVLVVGNPANTNAAIARAAAPDIRGDNFHAMMRLDHNRAIGQLSSRTGVSADKIARVTVWGNHSNTQVPDVDHAFIEGVPARERIQDDAWLDGEFASTVANRGAEIIKARGASSAASAANAAIDHVRNWVLGTPADDWVTIARPSRGEYGVPEGLVFGIPARSRDGDWHVVSDLERSERVLRLTEATIADLEGERDAVRALGITI